MSAENGRTRRRAEQLASWARRAVRSRWLRWLVGGGAALLVLAVGLWFAPPAVGALVMRPFLGAFAEVQLPEDLRIAAERSVLRSSDGRRLAVLFEDENRVRVEPRQIPALVRNAVLATEDRGFERHPGIDHRAIIRAALTNLRAGEIEEGGSTITQQLVKMAYLPARFKTGGEARETFKRKAAEALLALQLEQRLEKDEVLARYLNEAYFGGGVYGIATAAQRFFSKPLRALNASQAALLAGVLRAPGDLNPLEHPEAARERRNTVLAQLAETGVVTQQRAQRAQQRPLGLQPKTLPPPRFPFYVNYVVEQLTSDPRYDDVLGGDSEERERMIYREGLTITASLSVRMQQAAERAIRRAGSSARNGPMVGVTSVEPGNGLVRVMAVGPQQFGRCKGSGSKCGKTMVNPLAPGLGGSGRQPGSAFKPFVDVAALETGVPRGWEQRTAGGVNIPGCGAQGSAYRPENYARDPGVKDMREALVASNNVYHAKLAGLIGPGRIVRVARRLGLSDGKLPSRCSLALGSGTVWPVQMAAGFASFAAKGQACPPLAVQRITGLPGRSQPFDPSAGCHGAISEKIAAEITGMLAAVVDRGTGTAAQLDRPVAGKTGTTNDYRDAWFVGFVPQLATAVWVGYEQPEPLTGVLGENRVTGGSAPARIWETMMRRALQPVQKAGFADLPPRRTTQVPDLVGDGAQRFSQARRRWRQVYSFNPDVRVVDDWRERGTVLALDPPAGTQVDAGALLRILRSNGRGAPPGVPDVRGAPLDRARRVLQDAGYSVRSTQRRVRLRPEQDPPVPAGAVVATDPKAGTPLRPGKQVTVRVLRVTVTEPTTAPTPTPTARTTPTSSPTSRPTTSAPSQTATPSPGPTATAPRPPSPRPTPTASPAGRVAVTAVRANPDGDDLARGAGEFVELMNRGGRPLRLGGWAIRTERGPVLRIDEGYVLSTGQRLRVYSSAGTDRRTGDPQKHFNGRSRPALSNSGGTLTVVDDDATVRARQEY